AEASAYHSKWIADSPELYQTVTRKRLLKAAADTQATGYAQALRETNLLRREIASVFSSVELLITPTTPGPAETFAESKNFDRVGLQNTSPFNIFGLPSISVP